MSTQQNDIFYEHQQEIQDGKETTMKLIKQVTITPHQARELEHLGFIVKFKMMHLDGYDTYEIYAEEA